MDAAGEIVERVMAGWALRERAPGIAWGLVRDDKLIASGGIGTLRVGENAVPTADSVFRIASLTKSFTGSVLMSLVAEERIRLDEPVATYLPALASWRGPTTHGPPLTVRHLVSMESGLPTDDAWADRHLDLSQAEMEALIDAGATFTWTPGTTFEYSNLGWGLLGQIILAVTGEPVQELISRELLAPLGMSRTSWVRPDHDDIAEPYHWRDGAWVREPHEPGDGAIAPMGGLWSTVRDLTRWVSFFIDAWVPRGAPESGPVPRWARREMQQLRRVREIESVRPRLDGPARTAATGYGIGLGIRLDTRLGPVIGHSGGFPGYGSHMRWIPDRGVGVVALSNVTYGDMHAACIESLERLADADELPPARRTTATPATLASAERAIALANDWRDDAAAALFADNVAMDEAFERRAAHAARVVARHGALGMEAFEADTPTEGDVVAADGDVRLELAQNHEGKVQWWKLVDRMEPSDAPIITDPVYLAAQPRSAYVLLRPTGDLADAFDRWQGDVLDRLGRVTCALPTPHVTLKSYGSSDTPITAEDEERMAEVVREWAAATPPLELRSWGLELFEGDEQIPVALLESDDVFRSALRDLWDRSASAGLPAGYSDHIGADGWRAHLSLCYPETPPPPSIWDPLRTWTRYVEASGVTSLALEAELVAFGEGVERGLGRYRFTP
jgi:CubicO group peptidase (beta-lactamase class C family)/2'-5' RNA ligase